MNPEMFGLLTLYCFLSGILRLTYSSDIVEIENGKIQGEVHETFISYKGIPYAQPPLKNLRFANPQKYTTKWKKVRKANKYSPPCAQIMHFTYEYEGSEDCLYLNVHVPTDPVSKRRKHEKRMNQNSTGLPVIFYIHGGAFMYGSGDIYGPELLVPANVILVTINYRLNIFGFLSSEDDILPGNLGMKDQVMALQWMKNNIKAFGGDPDSITITGFSAGGASVHLHYMSPLSKGLFKNGISHSGTALNPWVMQEKAAEKMKELAEEMKCEYGAKVLDCLRKKKAKDIVEFGRKYQKFLYNPFSPFGVVVEKGSNKDKFLDEHPKDKVKKKWESDTPWLLSMTKHEGLYPASEFYAEKKLQKIDSEWDEICPYLIDINSLELKPEENKEVCDKVRKEYFGSDKIDRKSYAQLRQLMTDRLFLHGAYKTLKLQDTTRFYYHFSMYTENRLPYGPWWSMERRHNNCVSKLQKSSSNATDDGLPPISDDYLGVAHGDDVFLIYYYKYSRGPNFTPFTEEEKCATRNLIGLYSQFNENGVPVFGSTEIPIAVPLGKQETSQGLEIYSSKNYKIVPINESHGNSVFWDSLNLPE